MTVSDPEHRIAASEYANDIAHGPPDFDRSVHRADSQVVQRHRLGFEVPVDLIGNRLEVQPGSQRTLHAISREIENRQTVLLGLGLFQPSPESIDGRPMMGVVDDEHRLDAPAPRDLDLAHHRGMDGVGLPFECAARIVFLRLMCEDQHGFTVRVDRLRSRRTSSTAPKSRSRRILSAAFRALRTGLVKSRPARSRGRSRSVIALRPLPKVTALPGSIDNPVVISNR